MKVNQSLRLFFLLEGFFHHSARGKVKSNQLGRVSTTRFLSVRWRWFMAGQDTLVEIKHLVNIVRSVGHPLGDLLLLGLVELAIETAIIVPTSETLGSVILLALWRTAKIVKLVIVTALIVANARRAPRLTLGVNTTTASFRTENNLLVLGFGCWFASLIYVYYRKIHKYIENRRAYVFRTFKINPERFKKQLVAFRRVLYKSLLFKAWPSEISCLPFFIKLSKVVIWDILRPKVVVSIA